MNLVSWKSIELQVALPRVQDAGKEQDLMSKQNQRFQETLTQSQLQEEMQKRTQVNKFDQLKKTSLTEQEKEKEESQQGNNKDERKKKPSEEGAKHPYLGSNIDFNG